MSSGQTEEGAVTEPESLPSVASFMRQTARQCAPGVSGAARRAAVAERAPHPWARDKANNGSCPDEHGGWPHGAIRQHMGGAAQGEAGGGGQER